MIQNKTLMYWLKKQSLLLGAAAVLACVACSDDTAPAPQDDSDDGGTGGGTGGDEDDDDVDNGGTGGDEDDDDVDNGGTGGDGPGGGGGAIDDDEGGSSEGPVDLSRRCNNEFISLAAALDVMQEDASDLSDEKAKRTRYVTLTEMWNGGFCDDALALARFALDKAVNSLSGENGLEKLVPIEENNTIFRLDLSDYGWDEDANQPQETLDVGENDDDVDDENIRFLNDNGEADKWERLVRAGFDNDLDATSGDDDVVGFGQAVIRLGQLTFSPEGSDAEDLEKDLKTQFPFVNGLALINLATQAPLYHDLVEIPANLGALEAAIGLDISDDIGDEDIERVGLQVPGFAERNRVLERHRTGDGVAWLTYDFANDACPDAGDADCSNIFKDPVGFDDGSDGGEVLFQLPNDLFGYMTYEGTATVVADAARADEGQINIVTDPGQSNGVVRNGISCISCHEGGVVAAEDVLRNFVEESNEFDSDDEEFIKAVHPEADDLLDLFTDDAKVFNDALDELNPPRGLADLEPIDALFAVYEAPLDRRLAAAELWLEEDDLDRNIGGLDDSFEVLTADLPIPRDQFAEFFTINVCELDLGEVNAGEADDVVGGDFEGEANIDCP